MQVLNPSVCVRHLYKGRVPALAALAHYDRAPNNRHRFDSCTQTYASFSVCGPRHRFPKRITDCETVLRALKATSAILGP